MKIDYIIAMDFTYKNVEITNCKNIKQLKQRIKRNEIIDILNGKDIEHINSSYIIFFGDEI